MQNIQNLDGKKLAFLIMGFGGIFLVVAIFLIMTSVQPSKNNSESNQPFPTGTANTPQGNSNQTSLVAPSFYTDPNNTYSVIKPSGWQSTKRDVVGGGTTTKFNMSSGDVLPVLYIESDPIATSSFSLVDIANNINYYKFPTNSTNFQGQNALAFGGISPDNFTSPVTNKTSQVYKQYYLFAQNNKLFIINYEYSIGDNEVQSKSLIQQILNSFKFE